MSLNHRRDQFEQIIILFRMYSCALSRSPPFQSIYSAPILKIVQHHYWPIAHYLYLNPAHCSTGFLVLLYEKVAAQYYLACTTILNSTSSISEWSAKSDLESVENYIPNTNRYILLRSQLDLEHQLLCNFINGHLFHIQQ